MEKHLRHEIHGADMECCGEEEFFQITSRFDEEGKVFSITGAFPSCTNEAFLVLDGFSCILHERDDEPGPFVLVFNSVGGDLNAMLTLLDELGTLRSPIYTVAHSAQSGAAMLFVVAGAHGKRFVYPNSELALHNASGGGSDAQNKHYLEDNVAPKVAQLLDEHCDVNALLTARSTAQWPPSEDPAQRCKALSRLLDSDQYFNAQEALAFGLADEIITSEIAQQLFAPPVKQKRGRRA